MLVAAVKIAAVAIFGGGGGDDDDGDGGGRRRSGRGVWCLVTGGGDVR